MSNRFGLAPQPNVHGWIVDAVPQRMLDAASLQADVAQHLVVKSLDLAQRTPHLEFEADFLEQPAQQAASDGATRPGGPEGE